MLFTLLTQYSTQAKQFRFEKMQPNEPLFGERITQVIKSTDGFIWICGIDGASRFDGYNGINFLGHDSIEKNRIFGNRMLAMHESKDGRIWLGNNKGLNVFTPQENSFQYIKSNVFNTIRISFITSYNDSLLVTSSGNSSYLFNTNTNAFVETMLPHILKAKARDINENIWWGTKSGMLIKNDSTKFTVKGSINDLFFTSCGHLYVATNNGLFIIEKQELDNPRPTIKHYYIGREKTSISHKELSSIAFYQGQIWIGSRSGLNQVVINKNDLPVRITKHYHQTNNPYSISNNQVTKLLTDNEGILWIATFNGLNILDPSKQWFNAFQYQPKQAESLHDNNIICIDGDARKNVWISGFNSGLTKYSAQTKHFKHFHKGNSGLHNDHLRQISTINDDQVFFYNDKGISYFDAETNLFKQVKTILNKSDEAIKTITHQIFETKNNQIWLGTKKALYKAKFINDSFIIEHFCALSDVSDIQMTEDQTGRLWLATDKGIYLIFPKNPKRTRHFNTTSNSEFITSNFTDIAFDTNNNLWLCNVNGLHFLSNTDLLNLIPSNYQFKRYSIHDGLPSNHTVAILPDINGRMWVSTWNGIARFDPFGTNGHFTIFDSSDGLISQKYTRRSAFKDTDSNTFYFGGVNGVNYINPLDVNPKADNQTLSFYSINLEDDNVDNNAISVTKSDTLILEQKKAIDKWELIFHFNSLLSHNHQNFKWRYLHPDSTWHLSATPSIEFENLSNGEYNIEIMPILPNGESGKAKVVQLFVKTPNYRLILAIIGILVILISWLIIRFLKAKNKKPKYRYSNLSQDESSLIFKKLEQYMQHEKPYLNSKLTVDELTKYLDVSNVTFSQVLNKFKNTSFYEYVNHYRVIEFKQRLADGYNPNLTLLGLAEECGFSSKSSFYRAFKKETNLTPAQYEKAMNDKATKN